MRHCAVGARGLPQLPAGILVSGYLVIACGLFNLTNFASLHAATQAQTFPEEQIAGLGIHHAVVLAPPYAAWAFAQVPEGTWMLRHHHFREKPP